MIGRLFSRLSRQAVVETPGVVRAKSWHEAQEYELRHTYDFMSEVFFTDLFRKYRAGELNTANGYFNELFVREFFANDIELFRQFLEKIQGKACLDIGPCVFTPLVTWHGIGAAAAIEPLGDAVREWQREHFDKSVFDDVELRSVGADVFIPEFESRFDGAIHCRNMLDHTPNWPFVLSNISAYAAPGCHLLLWTDIDHRGTADAGHFDICSDAAQLKRLLQRLGFEIERDFEASDRPEVNWGCIAVKRT
jgi:hypothetical protein